VDTPLIIKLDQYKFDYNQIKKDVYFLLEKHKYIPQLGLTHSTADLTEDEKILESVGSIFDYDKKVFKFRETDFTVFNEAYRDLYLYEVYKSIPNIGRFRIMNLEGPKCYTIHKDFSKRYHYVVDTNPNCMFIFPGLDKIVRVPFDASLHLLDTRYSHTFVNGSRLRRVHLVMDDLTSLISPDKLRLYS
jgi:hypothetical protein